MSSKDKTKRQHNDQLARANLNEIELEPALMAAARAERAPGLAVHQSQRRDDVNVT